MLIAPIDSRHDCGPSCNNVRLSTRVKGEPSSVGGSRKRRDTVNITELSLVKKTKKQKKRIRGDSQQMTRLVEYNHH